VYGFIACCLAIIGMGMWRKLSGTLPISTAGSLSAVPEGLTLFLVLRAFSSGCASLTGIEAVANGVQAFREPRAKNAAAVMVWLAAVLATTVIGVSFLTHWMQIKPVEHVTLMSQIGREHRGAPYPLLPAPDHHGADSDLRGQHQLRGLSPPVGLHGS